MRNRLVDLDDRMEDLADRVRAAPELAQDFHLKYELSWLHHEHALEGVFYSGQELQVAMSGSPVADATTISAFRELRDFRRAAALIREEAQAKRPKVTLTLVRKLYEMLDGEAEAPGVAELRKEIPIHRAYFHEIAQPAKIAAMLDRAIELTETTEFRQHHALVQGSRFQHAFMQAYPFSEHSGKIARLVSTMFLVNSGFLPCIIHSIDRQRYYESLRGPETALRDLMTESMENALASAEKAFRATAEIRSRRNAAR
jgi:Fic family protein